MPTAETLRALIALVEGAKAGSRELDGQLTAAFDPPMDYAGEPADIFIRMNDDDCGVFKSYHATPASYTWTVPLLTTSIDAALALVAKVLPEDWPDLLREGERTLSERHAWHICFAKAEQISDLPLAILAALLRALLQQSETASAARSFVEKSVKEAGHVT